MVTIIEKVISLRKVQAFQNMNTDELRLLADISEEATYSSGQQILVEGERGDALYVIISGKVSVQRKTVWDVTPGDITYLATLGPGEYFAECPSLMTCLTLLMLLRLSIPSSWRCVKHRSSP